MRHRAYLIRLHATRSHRFYSGMHTAHKPQPPVTNIRLFPRATSGRALALVALPLSSLLLLLLGDNRETQQKHTNYVVDA